MQPSIPIPTDNIYKFVCLFGIAIYISSMLGGTYFSVQFTELVSKNILELEALKAKENLSSVESKQIQMLKQTVSIYKQLQIICTIIFVSFIFGSLFLSIWGMYFWFKKVQPIQDELLNLQIEKTRREIQVLEKQLQEKDAM